MEAQAAKNGAGQAIAAGAEIGELAEGRQRQIAGGAGDLRKETQTERAERDQNEYRHHQRDRDQETEEQLDSGPGIFEAVARDFGVGPHETGAPRGGAPK